MNNASCKICEELQDIPEGTAPPRTEYNQPTMYDHMSNYSQFKEMKDRDRQLKAALKKIVKDTTNEQFTDLKIDSKDVDKLLQNFSTQSIAKFKWVTKGSEKFDPMKFRNILKENDSIEEEGDDDDDDDNDNEIPQRSIKSTDTILNISRSPITCPVQSCRQIVGITSVLSHYLRDHKQYFPIDLQDIIGSQRSVLAIEEAALPYNENVCLGILAYGGKDSNSEHRPALLGICKSNAFLPEKYSRYMHHLPILIMGCKTSLSCLLKNKLLVGELSDPNDREQDIIVIWLTSVETTKTIHCTITTLDNMMTVSRSTIAEVRNIRLPQNPADFMPEECNYLKINRSIIDCLTNNGESPVDIEIFIHEFNDK